jgi:hypothetical protein
MITTRLTQEYMVAAPAAAVEADQMNVFYVGVENPSMQFLRQVLLLLN